MSSLSLPILIGLIVTALAFDFLNGLHDTANSIATLVSTRMLRPRYAVMWAAFFNFIAFLVFGVHVARTVGIGIVAADVMDAQVIFGALTGAIVWNLVTWWVGIPSSSSHALIGGLVGAGLTVGSKITRMTPVQGCCASAGGAIMLFAATYLGIPVSTTHTVTGSVIGVGAARKVSAVRWNIAANIVIAWILTLPASALMAALCYIAVRYFLR